MKSQLRENVGQGRGGCAEPITLEAENQMWRSGVLGEERPTQLRDTVMYLIGLTFALRGGEEQR